MKRDKNKTEQFQNKGFTLIELLVVIAIIALLASVVLVSINNARAKARDVKRVGDLTQLMKAFELFFNYNGSYPTSVTSGAINSLNLGLTPTYLITMPSPVLPREGNCNANNPGGNDYYFYANSNSGIAATYTLTFCLGYQTGNLGPGAHTMTQGGFQ